MAADPLLKLPPVPAWLVTDGLGGRAVFLDQGRARDYAAKIHGMLHALCVRGGPWCNQPAPQDLTDG